VAEAGKNGRAQRPVNSDTRCWIRLLFAIVIVCAPTLAQEYAAPRDSTSTTPLTLSDIDRLLAMPEGTSFEYTADSFVEQGDSLLLRGNAVVLHRGARLEAGEMVYHLKEQFVEARALIDSSGAVGSPTLKKGSDLLRGERIFYDMESGEGTILAGRIEYKKGFYGGESIETRPGEEFHVHEGSYTTCDRSHPHFDFYSPRIKVLAGEMAIARPVYFRIGETRLFWIPFYVFSLRENRQSGLLTPGFGRRPLNFTSQESEWEVRNLGYYFAPSEHWDLLLSSNLRQRSGWLSRGRVAYARRYHFDGRIETRLENRQSQGNVRWEWWTTFRHNQQLSQSANIRASGTFQSSKNFTRDNSDVLQERLNRTLRTNVRFDKRWREAGYTLNVSASRNENLDTDSFDEVRPEVSIRSNRKSLFGTTKGGRGGPWYSRIYYDANGRLRNSRRGTAADTTSATSADLAFGLSSQQRPLSWLNVNASLRERWRDADLRSAQARFEGVRTDRATLSMTLSQTIYGMFFPSVFPRVTAIRHVLKPDIGVRYEATRADTGGTLGFGGRSKPWKQSRRLTFRLANSLWAKVLRSEEEQKVRLAQVNFSTSYDFDRDTRPLSDLVSSLTADVGRRFDTRVSLRSEFYDDDDKLLRAPRLRQFEVNSTMRFLQPQGSSTGRNRRGRQVDDDTRDGYSGSGPYSASPSGRDEFGFEGGLQRDIRARAPRQLQLSHYFSRRKSFAGNQTRSWARTAAGWSWRQLWHFHYSVNYDLHAPGSALLAQDRVTSELLSVQRQFHDWSATVNIEPSRFAEDHAFYFKAQFEDIPQIRFERGERGNRR
jgi:hypothetical protein